MDLSLDHVHSTITNAEEGFSDALELKDWLHTHGVALQLSAVQDLLKEQREGAAKLYLLHGKPVRELRVVNVRILSEDGRRTLIQTHKASDNGTLLQVLQPLSGKLRAEDTEEAAARRCAEKELGIQITPLVSTRSQYLGAKSTSRKFPGLSCRFIVVTFDATVDLPDKLLQRAFTTRDSTFHWAWTWRLALPSGAAEHSDSLTPAYSKTPRRKPPPTLTLCPSRYSPQREGVRV